MARLVDQLQLMAEHLGQEVGFVDLGRGERLTFAAWDEQARRLAGGLAGTGVRPGDRVALHLPLDDAVRWVIGYAAIHHAGAVAVPLNSRFVARELVEVLDHAGVSTVLTGGDRWPLLARVLGSLPALRLVVGAGLPEGAVVPDGIDLVPWDEVAAGVRGWEAPATAEDDVADIVYTSGTTGRPKGVVVRHANASLLPNGVPGWSGAGYLWASPLFTFAGITAIYNPMKLGMTGLYLPRFDAEHWLRAVEEERPAIVFLVPAMAELLLAHPGFATADLSSIGLCAVGSAPLAPEVQRRLQARLPHAAVSNAYGMTEAGAAFTVLPKEEAERRPGSVGQPLPPAEMFAVDADGVRLPAGEVGELVIRLPGRQREYYRDPEASARLWHADGLHTGDLARFDEDGYLYIVGRTKEVIIRGGHNVYASDVEAVLYEHPDVAEAVVAGIPHPVLGEDVGAWVVLRPGATADADALRTFLAGHLSNYKVPRRLAVVGALPRNATGKVVKADLPPLPPAAPSGGDG